MEIEAKPKLHRNYAVMIVQFIRTAHENKMEPERFTEFMQVAEQKLLDDMQAIAETAFIKGREYERRNGQDAQ